MSTVKSPPPPTRRQRRAAEHRRADRRPAGGAARSALAPARPPLWRSPLVIVTAAAFALMAGIIAVLALTSTGTSPGGTGLGIVSPPASQADRYADGQALGDAAAPVVLEVYSDYQCPVCGRFSREILPRLISTYVATGELRIVDRSIAFLGTGSPDESLDAAAAVACAAPENHSWSFHDYLMWNQSGENDGAFRRERLFAMADRIGLDRDAFAACLDDPSVRGTIVERTQEAGAAGINSTPTFVVNGERVVGLVPYETLANLIDTKLDAAAGS